MNPGDPIVSVIIIFRDEERFLAEAVDSVMVQAGPAWELLLVDDGSTDGSTALARGRASSHPGKVAYLEHPGHAHRGMSATRNLGLARAKGEFVAFLDADDVWLPGKLTEQVAIARRHPEVAMVYGRTLIWNSWRGHGDPDAGDFYFELGVEADAVIDPPMLAALLIDNKTQSPTTCNAIIRRKDLEKVGGFENRFAGMFEDQAAFLKLMLENPVYVSSRTWARYRQHPDSCTSQSEAGGDTRTAYLDYLQWAEAEVAARRPDDVRLTRALARKRREVSHPSMFAVEQWLRSLPFQLKRAFKQPMARLGFPGRSQSGR